VNPYEVGSLAVRDEDRPKRTHRLRVAMACAGIAFLYYVISIAFLVFHIEIPHALQIMLGFGLVFILMLGVVGFVLGSVELVLNRDRRLRSAFAAFANGALVLLPAWAVISSTSQILSH
jgi:hypothetical protein